jgi:hypothetical protein
VLKVQELSKQQTRELIEKKRFIACPGKISRINRLAMDDCRRLPLQPSGPVERFVAKASVVNGEVQEQEPFLVPVFGLEGANARYSANRLRFDSLAGCSQIRELSSCGRSRKRLPGRLGLQNCDEETISKGGGSDE